MAFEEGTCNICGEVAERPRKRFNGDCMTECCACSCHDQHVGSMSSHAIFVRAARSAGLAGSGVGFGAGVCGAVA